MKELLPDFMRHLRDDRGLAANSLDGYRRDLEDVLAELERLGITDPQRVQPQHLTAYLRKIRSQSRSNATVLRRRASIRAFFRYLQDDRLILHDPSSRLEAPKPERKPQRAMSEDDIRKLLESPNTDTPSGVRDRTMLEVLYASGLRVSELLALDLEHVRTELGLIVCVGPGGKERMVPIGSFCVEWVIKYIQEARPCLTREDKPDPALFLGHLGTRMTRQGCWKKIKELAREAGVDETMTPHTLRRSFAAHLLSGGADLRSVQEMLGHAAAASTQAYQPTEKRRLKEVYDRAHPRAREKE
ncbi:tyrosine recombinase [Cohnella zeiphila]|uniref:Tyrosine recombinase XerC n=1 Tax=Cohnella zeiphila TaxID=2761120 RepID=A0A7X0VUN7_9BACL|nr:tyrosine recombinase [Cohnella zeiphila]MBB6730462.1 tyrosine recombinase [Cohnella zeiphila]